MRAPPNEGWFVYPEATEERNCWCDETMSLDASKAVPGEPQIDKADK